MRYVIEFESDYHEDAEYVRRRLYDAINEANIRRGEEPVSKIEYKVETTYGVEPSDVNLRIYTQAPERIRDPEKELLRERRGLPANPPENGKEIDRVPMLTWAYKLGPGDVWQAACWHEDEREWWDDNSFTPLSIQPELYWHLPKGE